MKLIIIICLYVLSIHSLSAQVRFEMNKVIVDSVKLGSTQIQFDKAVHLLGESKGTATTTTPGVLEHDYTIQFDKGSFFITKKKLYFNGLEVLDFIEGENYFYKNRSLYDSVGKKMKLGDGYFTDDLLSNVLHNISRNNSEYDIKIKNESWSSGGTYEYYGKGFAIYVSGLLIVKVWNHELFVWGVNYGKIEKNAVILLKERKVIIDGVEKALVH